MCVRVRETRERERILIEMCVRVRETRERDREREREREREHACMQRFVRACVHAYMRVCMCVRETRELVSNRRVCVDVYI